MSETSDIVTPALKALESIGIECWRMNAGGRRGRVTLAPSGTPDIMGYLSPNGRMFALEAKMPGKKPTDVQQAWHDDARAAGVLVAVINSAAEAVQTVQAWRIRERASSGRTTVHSSDLPSPQALPVEHAPSSEARVVSPARGVTSGTSGKRLRNGAVGR